ncbi:MAG TPA: hypothetical protein VK590_04435, partial [Saprospiraceae bacterium]|nr:hypothetical protein [Saprospiraceae bacterium]
ESDNSPNSDGFFMSEKEGRPNLEFNYNEKTGMVSLRFKDGRGYHLHIKRLQEALEAKRPKPSQNLIEL